MKKILSLITLLLLSMAMFAEDFNIVGTWYQYESDVESLDGIWVFKADNTGTLEEFHKGQSEGVDNFKYDFDASNCILTIYIKGEEDDPSVMKITIVSPTKFTYSEGRDVLTWIKDGSSEGENSGGSVSHAVNDRVSKFFYASSNDGLTYNFNYDDQGRFSLFTVTSTKESLTITWEYASDMITIKYTQNGAIVTDKLFVSNDKVVKEEVWITNGGDFLFNTLDFTYDEKDQLVKIVTKSDFESWANSEMNLIWEDGNIKEASVVGSKMNTSLTFDYDTAHEIQSLGNAFSGSVAMILNETEAVTLSPMLFCANYFGKQCKNLTKRVSRNGSNTHEGTFNEAIDYSYEFDGNGHVKKCNFGNKEHQYEWEASSGIVTPALANHLGNTIFTFDGRSHDILQRGLNIIRQEDGKVIKIFKK